LTLNQHKTVWQNRKSRKDDANRILVTNGYFASLHKILQEYDVSKELGAKIKVMLFKHLMGKINEAKKELARLNASIQRVEAACSAGTVPSPAEGLKAFTPAVNRLLEEVRTFDGWVISLLESDISLVAMTENPETAGIRVNGLQKSFAALWNLRIPGLTPLQGYPDVFDMSIFVP